MHSVYSESVVPSIGGSRHSELQPVVEQAVVSVEELMEDSYCRTCFGSPCMGCGCNSFMR